MNIEAIKREANALEKNKMPYSFEYEMREDALVIMTPYLDANNDGIYIYLEEKHDEILMTDGYNTMNEFELSMRDIEENELAKKAMERYLKYYRVETDEDGLLYKQLNTLNELQEAILEFVKCIQEVSNLKVFFDH